MAKKIDPVSGIYLLTVRRPGALPLYYVGQSIQINRRLVYHRKTLKAGRHDNDHLQKAFTKYGADALVMEVLEQCSALDIDDIEQWWLDEMVGHSRVLNIARHATAPNRGRKFGPDTRQKVADALRRRIIGSDTRKLISERMSGCSLSEETKQKISATKLARSESYVKRVGSLHHASKPVEGICITTGQVVTFESTRRAKEVGFDQSAVSKACRGELTAYKGYTWRWASSAA